MLQPLLPSSVTFLEPEGIRWGETWLRIHHADQITWFICDAFFNWARRSTKPMAKTMQLVMDAAPGLRVSRVVKWVMVRDRSVYKAWVTQKIDDDQPAVLVPAHGGIDDAPDLPTRLHAAITHRFG